MTPRREASRASASNGAEVAGTRAIVRATRSRAFGRLLIGATTLLAMLLLAEVTMAAPAAVAIDGFRFVPPGVTVNVGDSVTWLNRDPAVHTATAAGAFNTGNLSMGESRSIVMTRAGTFPYRCEIHTAMTGTVTVLAAATPPPTTAPPAPEPSVSATPVTSAVARSSAEPRSDPAAPGSAPPGSRDTGPSPALGVAAGLLAIALVGFGAYRARGR